MGRGSHFSWPLCRSARRELSRSGALSSLKTGVEAFCGALEILLSFGTSCGALRASVLVPLAVRLGCAPMRQLPVWFMKALLLWPTNAQALPACSLPGKRGEEHGPPFISIDHVRDPGFN